jgi:DNA-directed RNA polymerase subunit RPC12/RpoP
MSMDLPRFSKKNDGFVCCHCHAQVPPASATCRDHCPHCLWSLHVDVNPGDRASSCGGFLRPVGYHRHGKKGWMIDYVCTRCGMKRVNRFLESDVAQPDGFDALLALTPEQGRS